MTASGWTKYSMPSSCGARARHNGATSTCAPTLPEGVKAFKHKLVDWEAGALYWNVHRRPDWQEAMRYKFVTQFSELDVMLLMGTIHRFPGQWLIVSVLYPPRLPETLVRQQTLF